MCLLGARSSNADKKAKSYIGLVSQRWLWVVLTRWLWVGPRLASGGVAGNLSPGGYLWELLWKRMTGA